MELLTGIDYSMPWTSYWTADQLAVPNRSKSFYQPLCEFEWLIFPFPILQHSRSSWFSFSSSPPYSICIPQIPLHVLGIPPFSPLSRSSIVIIFPSLTVIILYPIIILHIASPASQIVSLCFVYFSLSLSLSRFVPFS